MSTSLSGLPLLYLCRHGQTDWNAEGRIQGQREIALNETGRQQARRNGERLAELLGSAAGFDFLASPMARTFETMRIVRTTMKLPEEDFRTDSRLVELNFGNWEGFTVREIGKRDPVARKARLDDKWNYVPEGDAAESYAMLAERVRPAFLALDRPTVMVAHGGVTRVFLALYAGVDREEAAHQLIPQDKVLQAEDGRIAWV